MSELTTNLLLENLCIHSSKVTRINIANLCCSGEEKIINNILHQVIGIYEVSINTIGRYAIIKHCPNECCTSIEDIINKLNEVKLGASIQEADETFDTIENEKNYFKIFFLAILIILFIDAFILQVSNSNTMVYNSIYIVGTVIGAVPIINNVYIAFIRRTIDINVLMFIALIGAMIIQQFLDANLLVVLYSCSLYIEEAVLQWVRNIVNTSRGRIPKNVNLSSGKRIPLKSVKPGDVVSYRAGDMISIDGKVVKGQGFVNESSMTGEAIPVQKDTNSIVISGTVMQNGYIEVEVTDFSENSTVQKLENIIMEVQTDKGKLATMLDSFSIYWTPGVLVLTFLTFIIAGSVSEDWSLWTYRSLALLVLACPCAVIVSASIPCAIGIAIASKRGVVIKGSSVIERMGEINLLALDKTGTLTKGLFTCSDRLLTKEDKDDYEFLDPIQCAASLESKSSHPLANAIVSDYLGCIAETNKVLLSTENIKVVNGVGIEGWIAVDEDTSEWVHCSVGNEKLLKANGGKCKTNSETTKDIENFYIKYKNTGSSIIMVAIDDKIRALVALSDVIREEAPEFIEVLLNLQIEAFMLTGDQRDTACYVSNLIGIHPSNIKSRLQPIEKLAWIQSMNQLNSKNKIMMVGDGINDAAALAAAHVGVAMGQGCSAMASTAASVIIMSENLLLISSAIKFCKMIRRIIYINILFAIFLKVIAVGLALSGNLLLWEAIFIDISSLLFVILNSTRVLISRETIWGREDNNPVEESKLEDFVHNPILPV